MTREEIESLGWVLNENSGIYHNGKYKLMHVPSMDNKTRVWTETSNVGFSDTIFEGTINTIEELVVLQKQLNINDN